MWRETDKNKRAWDLGGEQHCLPVWPGVGVGGIGVIVWSHKQGLAAAMGPVYFWQGTWKIQEKLKIETDLGKLPQLLGQNL